MATAEAQDKRLLTGDDRTPRQKEADEQYHSEKTPLSELAWGLNRLYHELGHCPVKEDVREEGRYQDTTYTERFGNFRQSLKAANIPIDEYEMRLKDIRLKVPLHDLAWDINQTYHEIGETPRWKDIYEHGEYNRRTYERRFESVEEALSLSNVRTVVCYVMKAMREYVESGRCYATCKQLRSFMYPRGDMTDVSSDFGVDNSVPDDMEEEIKETWDYPQFSPRRVSSAIESIRDGDYGVDVEPWSDSQKTTWRIIIDE